MMESADAATVTGAGAVLICRAGARTCALPLTHVVETMRPLAIEPFAGAPTFVAGLSRIRGEHVPVIDLGRLLGAKDETEPTRFVLLRVGSRTIAIRVDAVIGVGSLPESTSREVPRLLAGADETAVATLAARDAELMLVLDSARLLPFAEASMPEPERES
ncbi:MAG TPA: chemotaxis protein CheW [Polyangiaceae bacterium]|nr:chemotaxis protein CheW [Polyangiaceae bacterium]